MQTLWRSSSCANRLISRAAVAHLRSKAFTIRRARYSSEGPSYLDLESPDSDDRIKILEWDHPLSYSRANGSPNAKSHFRLYPNYLNSREQLSLLRAALVKLDKVLGVPASQRQRRKVALADLKALLMPGAGTDTKEDSVEDALAYALGDFLPEDCYAWDEKHFDGVIRHYREAPISAFPPDLDPVIDKLVSLTPYDKEDLIVHALHLSSKGYIQPHIDNVEASGEMIMGVSLGFSGRLMRMTGVKEETGRKFEVFLESGDVYISSGVMRYKYKHEILKHKQLPEYKPFIPPGQRLSIMFRDKLGATKKR